MPSCKPVFCDVKASDGTIDEERIEDLKGVQREDVEKIVRA